MTAPTVTATPNKSNYQQGESVIITLTVQDAPTDVVLNRTQRIDYTDGEGNPGYVDVAIFVHTAGADTFAITGASWTDTGVACAVTGLQTSSVA